ncbi:MAG TPA: aspartate dehydrogenase domain-containing protein, partial [Trueperaceae bacterium]|nr:aspartate dehydrogenase domain-containing protein [Trueperaceae bacterium]
AALARRVGARVVAPGELAGGCDVVLEAAGAAAVRTYLPALWAAGVPTVVISMGSLVDPAVEAAYRDAVNRGVAIVLPSGGIAGLDGVRALAAGGGLRSARITTTKAPAGLQGAPYLTSNAVELPTDRAVTIFEGTAREAVAGFPANVNVAIALSLAGLGPDLTLVAVRSDPSATRTHHLIEVEGDAATIEVRIASKPSPSNPRTSYLAGASAVAALRELVASGRLMTSAT